MQDAHGLNVNLLLWCVWTAAHLSTPDEAALRRAMQISGEWEENIVAPLRQVRRKLKTCGGPEALRLQVKEAELSAEREVQSALEAMARRQLSPASDEDAGSRARRTLAAYARAAGAAKTSGFSVSLLEKLAGLTVLRLN